MATLAFVTTSPAAQEASVATVGYSMQLSPGDSAPMIPLVDTTGKQTSLTRMSKPIVIVAFTDSETQANAGLATLGKRFKHDWITVVQVTPTAGKQSRSSHVLTLRDPDRIAWEAYKKPAPGTVFLVNDYGKIAVVGSLSNLGIIERKAKRLNTVVKSIAYLSEMSD